MALSQAQIKGRIKNIAKSNKADARILIQIYMMETFLGENSKLSICREFYFKGWNIDYISGGSLYEINHGYRYFYPGVYFVAGRSSSNSEGDQ